MGRMTGQGCGEWQGIMAMEAIGRASEDEVRALAEHLEHCEQCRGDRADVRSAAGALTLLDGSQFDRPGAGVAGPARVVERIGARSTVPDPGTSAEPPPAPVPIDEAPARAGHRRWSRVAGIGAGVAAVAAAAVAVMALSASPAPPTRTVAMTGQPGVVASVSLTTQSWGTRATLRESGQTPGQILTVSMKSTSGRWWVAGSYRTTGRPGPVQVQLSCAVPATQITTVWVSNQAGHTVLDGYVG